MPVHDWTQVDDGIFHAFRNSWIGEMQRTLNNGVLPPDYYSLGEKESGGLRQQQLAIRHASNHRVVALVGIVSAGNKSAEYPWQEFLDKALAALRQGIHLLILDLHPPTPRDPHRVHGSIWGALTGETYEQPADARLTLVAYNAGSPKTAYVEPIAVGQPLTPMPLYLTGEGYIEMPLEATYMGAFVGVPNLYRRRLDPPR